MKIGQRVVLIANHNLTDLEPPRIGALGEIVSELDLDGDYMVSFPEYPCTVGEPEWFIPASYLVPVDDPLASAPDSVRWAVIA